MFGQINFSNWLCFKFSFKTLKFIVLFFVRRWVDGEILSLFSDEEGEWLEIGYENLSKQVQRFLFLL
jgi:hypothetical protein